MSPRKLTPRVQRAKKRQKASVPRRLELTTTQETPQTGVSALTTTTTAAAASVRAPSSEERNKVADQNEYSIYQLGNLPPSPLKERRTPLNEEETYDHRRYFENPGAEDSEDEADAMIGASLLAGTLEDAFEAQESNNNVEDTDYIPTVKKEGDDMVYLHGAPPGWKLPGAPESWKPKEFKPDLGEPGHNDVDNPGGWSEFTFRPKWRKTKKAPSEYLYHHMPTGVTPVPLNNDGKRVVNGWEFHYSNWTNDSELSFRDGANRDNMFPKGREGTLNPAVLKRLGLNKERMCEADQKPDALFFYLLLLPLHNIDKKENASSERDPRQPFYSKAAKWSNLYAVGELDLGSGYGHKCENVTPVELLKWDGVIVRDGVRGGSDGAIMRRFDRIPDSTACDELIDKAISKSRWLELKRVWKLCNNITSKKKDEEGYDPACKHDYIFETIINNVNALTLSAALDLCLDETSFGHQSWGKAKSGLLKTMLGKPGITKGMQTVICSDVHWIRPRACLH